MGCRGRPATGPADFHQPSRPGRRQTGPGATGPAGGARGTRRCRRAAAASAGPAGRTGRPPRSCRGAARRPSCRRARGSRRPRSSARSRASPSVRIPRSPRACFSRLAAVQSERDGARAVVAARGERSVAAAVDVGKADQLVAGPDDLLDGRRGLHRRRGEPVHVAGGRARHEQLRTHGRPVRRAAVAARHFQPCCCGARPVEGAAPPVALAALPVVVQAPDGLGDDFAGRRLHVDRPLVGDVEERAVIGKRLSFGARGVGVVAVVFSVEPARRRRCSPPEGGGALEPSSIRLHDQCAYGAYLQDENLFRRPAGLADGLALKEPALPAVPPRDSPQQLGSPVP